MNKYGFIGFVALLGFLGNITGEKWFYSFFIFVIFFEYFFKKPDELFVENMRRAAANAFWVSLISSVASTLYFAINLKESIALEKGVVLGFGLSIIVFCLSTAFFEWKEGRGISND